MTATHLLTPPKAILFDWDNTLVHSWPIIHRALYDTFVKWGKEPWSLEEVKLRVGKSLRDAFPPLFGDEWEAAGAYYVEQYQSYHLEELTILPDVLATLDYVAASPVFAGVVSNKRGGNLRKEARHLGWVHYFDAIIGAQDASHDKPHKAQPLMALEQSGVELGSDVWFVGDTPTDLECAHNGNMQAILFGDVQTDGTCLQGFSFAHHARTHKDLLRLLQEYC